MAPGEVIFVSGNGAMVVVKHDDGFALVEMIGDEGALSVGDTCSADWNALGSTGWAKVFVLGAADRGSSGSSGDRYTCSFGLGP